MRERREYTKEFKEAAVDLVRSSGRKSRDVAGELGISPENVRRWVREAADGERETAPKYGWNVSGEVTYDRKGRPVRAGQNRFVAGEGVDALLGVREGPVNATESRYDGLDRVTRITLPDGAEEKREYGVRGGKGYTVVSDPLGNRSVQERDGRGNIAEVRREDGEGRELNRAGYRYNGLGEMLVATDGKGNELSVSYDLAGRRVGMESRDMGRKTYGYDAAGNLAEESDTVLRER
ncbi:MAG: transposase, partial [Treponema sp.]|nr:transposase [Treponema sp.]